MIHPVNSGSKLSAAVLAKYLIAGVASISAGLALADPPTPARDPGVVTFNGQRNSGNQATGIEIQNVVVGDLEANATAIGNNLRVVTNDVFRSNNEMQLNTGNQTASIAIRGTLTRFTNAEVNSTSVGNTATYMGISNAGLSANVARQENYGNQTANVVWSEDPTTKMNINATALGNNLSIGRQ